MTNAGFALAPQAPVSVDEPLSAYCLKDAVRVGANGTICRAGDPASRFFRVTSGVTRSFVGLPDGRSQVTDFHFPGDLVGLWTGAQRGENHAVTVEAITDVILVAYSLTTPGGAPIPVSAVVTRMFLGAVAERLADAHERLLLLGRKSAAERLATFLLLVSKRTGSHGGEWIELPMSRGDIADYLGMTLETVSRMFRILRERRLILTPSLGQVRVIDGAALERLADGRLRVGPARHHGLPAGSAGATSGPMLPSRAMAL
jgi:CRP/FNR family transcriptional regulator, anaerobic regulatory protein